MRELTIGEKEQKEIDSIYLFNDFFIIQGIIKTEITKRLDYKRSGEWFKLFMDTGEYDFAIEFARFLLENQLKAYDEYKCHNDQETIKHYRSEFRKLKKKILNYKRDWGENNG